MFGRRAMGESIERADFADRWRIRRNGLLVHAEDFAVGLNAGRQLAAPPALGNTTCVGTVLVLSDDADRQLDAVRAILGKAGAASAWTVAGSGKLLARLTAKDGYHLRKRLIPLIELLNRRAGLPKVWTL